MSNFQLPKWTVEDVNGAPVVGAKLYFYAAGTSTLQAVYSDKELTTPYSNPLIADGFGRVGPVYLDPDLEYKLTVNDASDALIYTVDNLEAYALSGAGDIVTRLKQVASNPLDYGALGDGVANEVAAVQSAIDNATYTIDLLGKTYRCDSPLTIGARKRLINGILDFSNCTSSNLITITGGSAASSLLLTADAGLAESSLTLASTATFSAGRWLYLTSNQDWSSGVDSAEILRVHTVASGTVLTIDSRLRAAYTTAQSGAVNLLTFSVGTRFENVEIRGSSLNSQVGIYAQYTQGVTVTNCRFVNLQSYGIDFIRSVDANVSECDFIVCGVSGVLIGEASRDCRVESSTFKSCALGVSTNIGINVGVNISRCSFSGISGTNNAVRINVATYGASIRDCVFHGSIGASAIPIASYGTSTTIYGCEFYGSFSHAVFLQPQKSAIYTTTALNAPGLKTDHNDVCVRNNTIRLPGNSGIVVQLAAGTDINGVIITDNEIEGPENIGIYVDATLAGLTHLVIDGNDIIEPNGDGILMDLGANACRSFSIDNNRVSGLSSSDYGIRLLSSGANGYQDGSVSGNIIGGGLSAILIQNSDIVLINNNKTNSTANRGIYLANTVAATYRNIAITGNTIHNAVSQGILYETSSTVATTGINVSSNNIRADNGTNGIHFALGSTGATTNVSVSGNVISGSGTHNIFVTSTAAGTVSNVNITGNTVSGAGTNGIYVYEASGTISAVDISGNSVLSATSSGIITQNITGVSVSGNSVTAAGLCIQSSACNRISITGNRCTGTSASTDGIYCLDSEHVVVGSNAVVSIQDGIYFQFNTNDFYTSFNVTGNSIEANTGIGLWFRNECGNAVSGISMGSNTVGSGALNGILIQSINASSAIRRCSVTGNSILSPSLTGIEITSNTATAEISKMMVSGNVVESPTGNGIVILGFTGNTISSDISVTGNTITDGGDNGVRMTDVSRFSCNGNIIHSPSQDGVEISYTDTNNRQGLMVSNNIIYDPGQDGIQVETTSTGDLENINISGNCVDSAVSGIKVFTATASNLRNLVINSNAIRNNTGSCIVVSMQQASATLDGFSIVGNDVECDDTSEANINLGRANGSISSGSIRDGVVASNSVLRGSIGIHLNHSGAASVAILGNKVHSATTGIRNDAGIAANNECIAAGNALINYGSAGAAVNNASSDPQFVEFTSNSAADLGNLYTP